VKITLTSVSKGRRGAALPPITLSFESDSATLARAETEQRPTVLGLVASGRMRPDTGTVTIDGVADAAAIRARIALVDAPGASDPAPDVTVAAVAMEELMFAGLPGTRRDAALTLAQLGMDDEAGTAMSDLAPDKRIRLLTELAILRDGVEGVVLVAPDRHGGDPVRWWAIARALAARGFAVLVIAGDASAAAIGAEDLLARLATTDPSDPADPADKATPSKTQFSWVFGPADPRKLCFRGNRWAEARA
jgi:hypothetical protein